MIVSVVSWGRACRFLGVLVLMGVGSAALSLAHDMFLVVPSHHLSPHSRVEVSLFNGTFDESLNTIDRHRMVDVSIVDGAGKVTHPALEQWRDEGTTTVLTFESGISGTYLVGVSTAASVIELSAEDFNDYLEHDGVVDVLAQRTRAGQLDKPVRERYSKHVKTVLQVGDIVTDHHTQWLGYPVEIVPQQNPGALTVGDTLEVLVLAKGSPVAEQLVYSGCEEFGRPGNDGRRPETGSTRTNSRGLARLEITRAGRCYIRLIRMLEVFEGDVDYESNWATLTFEID